MSTEDKNKLDKQIVEKMREELVKIRQEEVKNQELMERHRTRADVRAQEMDLLAKESKVIDPHTGRESTLMDIVINEAERALNADVNAYNDWRSAMMKLWNIYGHLAKAIDQSIHETIAAPALYKLSDALAQGSEVLNNIFRSDPEADLPALEHLVSVNEQGQLAIEPLTRSDNGTKTSQLLDNLFKHGVVAWLDNCGYKPTDETNSQFKKGDQILDKAGFKALNNNPETSLKNYLSDAPELEFRPRGP
ncbi:hypothetical protein [Legionella worsleiensis]|uniref:Membrane-associated HD superfamily hydrolase n=1 Tax=Legionella worsleiensis TaxID=45076 RepID=A0A0W1AJQ7_9GAMM|nr:hypothetical protein [Legionella worsleiensis]KTD81411.1 membrane-associated HD superfamily hydrolase [Legionella worsleiensis]STY30085.1 membrane-associated HD superfamily hydrolase [Legionella worsleiensis]